MEPEIIIKTKIDNEEAEDDLDDLIDEAEGKGSEAGEKLSEGFGKGSSKLTSKINNIIGKAFSKITGLGRGIVRVFSSITKILAGLGVGLGIISLVLGLLVTAGTILGGAFEKAFKENEELKANIQYIVFAVKKALEPATNAVANVLVGIVNLILKAIQYVAVLIKMLTGHNIFEGATMDAFADSMKSADKSSKGIAKNMKEASKQTTKFDEMNILQDNSSAGGGSGLDTGGFTMPTFDLSNLTNAEEELNTFIEKWKIFGQEMNDTLQNTPMDKWTGAFGKWGLAVQGVTQFVYGLWEIVDFVTKYVVHYWGFLTALISGDTKKAKKNFVLMMQDLIQFIDGQANIVVGLCKMVIGVIYGIIKTLIDWIISINVYVFNFIVEKINEAIGKANNKFNEFKGKLQNFVDGVTKIFGVFGTKVGEAVGNGFKGVINSVLAYIEWSLNSHINALNTLIKTVNKISPVKLSTVSTLHLPRLAKGGIINMPGRGVMVGSAIAGERGREGVLPLTDSQQMAMLGEAIGKYININATIPVYMGNRMVQREMRKIQAEDDFAFNR